MNASDPNLDELLKASAKDLIEEDLELLHSIDTSNTDISPKVIQRVRRTIKNYDKVSWWESVPVACRRVVAAVMVVCTLSFGLCMSVQAVRAEIVSTIMEWYDKFVAVFYVAEETPPSTIEEYREPMLQLTGTEKQIIQQGPIDFVIVYFQKDYPVGMYQQMIITDNGANLDNENCTVSNISVNNYDAQLFIYDDGSKTITWHDNEYAYVIVTESIDVATDVLISIAESVK